MRKKSIFILKNSVFVIHNKTDNDVAKAIFEEIENLG